METAMPGAFSAALRGNLPAVLEPSEFPESWDLARRLLLWLASPDASPEVGVPSTLPDRESSAWALSLRARVAWLTLDGEALRTCHGRLTAMRHPHAPLFATVVGRQLAALVGARPEDDLDVVQERARAWGLPSLAVEAVFASAIGSVGRDGVDARHVLSRARLACRMAQAEGLWLTHYTTSLCLARARRMTGHPHLGAMIARACLQSAPHLLRGRLRWELLHAGVLPDPAPRFGLAEHLTANATAWLRHGDLRARSTLDAQTGVAADCALDWSAVSAATSATPRAHTDAVTEAWLAGRTSEIPPVLSGLIAPAWRAADAAPPFVLGTPGRPVGRRVLGYPPLSEHDAIPPAGAHPARPEAVMSALTIAGTAGIEQAALFEDAYGFAFRPELHEATFKVVRHQARKQLEGYATVERDGTRLRLVVERPFAVVDPRVRQPLSHTVLRALVAGADSAKSIASKLGVPLRTVQMTLKSMVDEGACVAQREGRRVQYAVEDTTFCEITRA
ncbi:MAG: winged helix-turn-helix domain-containing protein [Sandaracinaceae bacterium]